MNIKKSVLGIRKTIRKSPSLNDFRLRFLGITSLYEQGKKPIFLFTSARSGSTWLMEIVSAARGIRFIREPMHVNNFYTHRYNILPSWKKFYSGQNSKSQYKKYLDDIIKGKIELEFPHQFWRNGYNLTANRLVFKFVHAHFLFEWLDKNFDSEIVYLIRHPIATILSRINWGWDNSRLRHILRNEEVMDFYPDDLINYSKKIFGKGSKKERFTVGWCLENYIPLNCLINEDWLVVSYEELVEKPKVMVKMLVENLNLSEDDFRLMMNNIPEKSGVSSPYENTTSFLEASDKEDDRSYLIKKWKNEVSKDEVNAVFGILDNFDIDIYQKDRFMPTRDYLNFNE